MIPEDLRYTSAHEWVRELEGGVVRIGITDHAQDQLGDVVFVQLPAVGDSVSAGSSIGEVESTKSVADIYAPLSGTALQNRYPALWRIPVSLNCLRLFSVLSNSINHIAGCLVPILSTSVSAPKPSS